MEMKARWSGCAIYLHQGDITTLARSSGDTIPNSEKLSLLSPNLSGVPGTNMLMITGESYRLREKRKSGLIRSRLTNVDPKQTHRETEVTIKKEPDGGVNNR